MQIHFPKGHFASNAWPKGHWPEFSIAAPGFGSADSVDPGRKYQVHPAPDIPVSFERRISKLRARARNQKADHAQIVLELESIAGLIQEAIELSVAMQHEPIEIVYPERAPDPIERAVGKRSMTAKLKTKRAQQEAFDRAQDIQRRALEAAEAARQEEDRIVYKAMEMIVSMLDH